MGKAIDKLKNIKIVKTLSNIGKIEDLRQRILITLMFVAVYRLGSYVVLPGIDTEALAKLQQQTSEGLMSLLDMFSGGAFAKASIFCPWNNALYFCVYRDAVARYCCSSFPENAERGRKWKT